MRAQSPTRAGFTLIELLAVIVILSILAWALISNLGDATKVVDIQATRVTLQKVGLAVSEFSDDFGDFPRSKFTTEQGTPPNAVNLGAECLYLALCGENGPLGNLGGADFVNTDGDQLARRPPGFNVGTLFELKDQWDNPVAYFHHSDYGREDAYATIGEDGAVTESLVRALKDEKLGRYYEARGFQLISAGPDFVFGTGDDVTQFNK